MKTYSRLKRAAYLSSEPPVKKRRILDDDEKDDTFPPSMDAAILRSDAACSPPRTSPPRQTGSGSSAARPSLTPPSSPPPPTQAIVETTSPLPLPGRKTAFSFFARRAATTSTGPRPIVEHGNAHNAQAKTTLSLSPSLATQQAAPKEQSSKATKQPQHRQQKRLTQLQLDLGVAPVQRTCKTCGMAYVPSNAEDAALHKRFHAMNVGGVDVGKGFFSRSMGAGKDGVGGGGGGGAGEVVWEKGVDGDFVVVVGRRGKVAARTRVRRVLDVVERELGAVEIPDDELWGQVVVKGETRGTSSRKDEGAKDRQRADVDGEVESKPQRAAGMSGAGAKRTSGEAVMRADRFKAYLYIRGAKCIGLCLVERIDEAHRVVAPSRDDPDMDPLRATNTASTILPEGQVNSKDTTKPSTDTTLNNPSATTAPATTTPTTLTISSATYPATLGISRIWVSSSHRRCGIALALLNAAARDSCAYHCEDYDSGGGSGSGSGYGKQFFKARIAFSQPTDSGARLARRWFGAETGWGVYW